MSIFRPTTFFGALLIAVSLVVSGLGPIGGSASALSGGEFRAGNIIDDAIFFNGRSMSAVQVQNFLNSKVTTCRSGYTCLKDYVQNTPARSAEPYLCNAYGGGNRSAAQIIVEVAYACGVNPQVLLVLLQKEQSLITDTWPEPIQYRSATGFGCPDTAPCDSEYYGFFNQVYHAARIYKKYARDASQYNYRSGRVNSILYNPNSACGRSDVYIQNQATAGLYVYTPYQPNQAALNNLYGTGDGCSAYGNRNFWRMFNDWFGSPHGSLVRTVDSGTIYYSDGQRRITIASMDVAAQFNLGAGDIRYVSQQELDTVPMASPPISNTLGTLIKSESDSDADGGTLYLADNGSRIPIGSLQQMSDFGLVNKPITYLPLATIQRLSLQPTMSYFLQAPDNTIYYMSNGKLSVILELGKLSQMNPSGKITKLTNFSLWRWGMTTASVDGDYKVIGPDGSVRVYKGGSFYDVTSMDVYSCWDLNNIKTFRLPDLAITNGTKQGNLNCVSRSTGNDNFLMNGDTRYKLPTDANINPVTPPDSLIGRLPNGTLKPVVKGGSAELSLIEQNLLRPLTSMNDFFALGHTDSSIQSLQSGAYKSLNKGARKLMPGALILEPNGTVSVISDQNSRLQISSAKQFEDFGFSWNALKKATAADLTAYPSDGTLSNTYRSSTNLYLVDGGVRYIVPSNLDAALGVNRTGLPVQDIAVVSQGTVPWAMTKFIKAKNSGTIYMLENGAKRPITNWNAFLRETANRPQDLLTLTPAAVAAFPGGSPVY